MLASEICVYHSPHGAFPLWPGGVWCSTGRNSGASAVHAAFAPFGKKLGISFHCCADDCRIDIPLSKKDNFTLRPLVHCREEIQTWTALNFLNFHDKKPEAMVFGPGSPCPTHPADVGPMAPDLKLTVSDLGLKLDTDLKLDQQMGAIVQAGFFHLLHLAQFKPLLSLVSTLRCSPSCLPHIAAGLLSCARMLPLAS